MRWWARKALLAAGRMAITAILLTGAGGDRARGQAIAGTTAPAGGGSDVTGDDFVPGAFETDPSFLGMLAESLFGDVYAEGGWRPLSLRTFFTEGWREPWAAPPNGREGLTPRQGWLGAFNGVFYRLWLADFEYVNSLNTPYGGNRYEGSYTIFLPVSRRFELRLDSTFLVANGTSNRQTGYVSRFGDLTITPRFLLAESAATTQIFTLHVEAPTGSRLTGNGVTALTPEYQVWTNPFGAWVARGSTNLFLPIDNTQSSVHTAWNGGVAVGRYFTPHDVPFGDLVFYAACDFSVPLDGTSATATAVGVGPGMRVHLGDNYFLMHYWEFPVCGPHPDTYSMQCAIVKVF